MNSNAGKNTGRNTGKLAGCILFMLLMLLMNIPALAAGDSVTVSVKGKFRYEDAYKILEYTNQIRAEAGVKPLTMDKDLLEAAMQRAAETALYFSHTRPDGSSCFTACPKMSGENIAAGTTNAKGVVSLWKNSPGHYQNMVSPNYKSIGIGCYEQKGILYFAVQCFGWREAVPVQGRPADKTRVVKIRLQKDFLMDDDFRISGMSSKNLEKGKTASLKLVYGDLEDELYFEAISLLWDGFRLSSNHPEILSVNSSGDIRGLKAGTATVTVTHPEFPGWAAKKTITVTDANSRTVTLNANGGFLSKRQNIKTQKLNVTYNKKYGTLPTPVKKGYTFRGWYTKKSGGSKITAASKVRIAKGKTQTLYARWSKITVKKAAISKVSTRNSSLTAKWKTVSGAKGYEVWCSTNSKFRSGSTKKILLTGEIGRAHV